MGAADAVSIDILRILSNAMPEQTRAAAAAVRLQATTDEIVGEVRRLPPELVTWIPAEGVWSVMDILCHIRELVPFWTDETLRRRPSYQAHWD